MLPSAVMLIIDQLPASLLGPYGNTIIETTGFNRLAAQSLLFDFAFANSLDLKTAYDRNWSVLNNGYESILITDEPEVANHPKSRFDRLILIDQPPVSKAAASSAGTQLANFFAQATAWLAEELEPEQLVWIHSQGLAGAWDAPYELRLKFAGEEDPPPPHFLESPCRQLGANERDPDLLLGYQQAAAAQLILIDDCLSVLLDELDESSDGKRLLLGCSSIRGCGLGEHGLVGIDQQLYNESIQVPLLLRFPDSAASSQPDYRRVGRSGSFVSLNSIPGLLQAWLSGDETQVDNLLAVLDSVVPDKARQVMTIINGRFEMIQTHAWKLIRSVTGEVQLYAKPDDRWDINDVSDRCPLIVEKLVDLLDRRIGVDATILPDLALEEELALRRD
jgi:hypothetical protein